MNRLMAFYADGTSSEEVKDGVQAVAEFRDGKQLLHISGEFYRQSEDGAWGAGPRPPGARSGLLMSDDGFQALKVRAIEWLLSLT